MRRSWLGVLALWTLLAAVGVAVFREARRRALVADGSASESCLACHVRPEEGPGGAHGFAGCASCHLGDPAAFDQERAHRGIEREPGALETADRTCGREGCHPEQAGRVREGLMATARGIVAVDRFALGLSPAPDGLASMEEVLRRPAPDAADLHLRRLCGGCHLAARKGNRDDGVGTVGSGCGACHGEPRPPGWTGPHGAVDARVPDRRCLGCHARSARISLSYQGLAEVRPGDPAGQVRLFDGRPGRQMPADRHHEARMECIDCHTHRDLMGDGIPHLHQEEAVEVACTDCHEDPGMAPRETVFAAVEDTSVLALLRLRGEARGPGEPVRRTARGTPLWNLRPSFALPASGRPDTAWALVRKRDGAPLRLRPTPGDRTHQQHRRVTCQGCHSAWIPWCADCHTRAVAHGTQWDFGMGGEGPGQVLEEARAFEARPPALGLRLGRFVPAAPGMAWTADLAALGGPVVERRLLAAFDPHTTGRRARPCGDCHPTHPALGNALDLAGDFEGTRRGLGPLDEETRRRLSAVGRCLPCHPSGP